MAFTSRDVRHFPQSGVSIGVDVENGQAKVALACVNRHRNDTFGRKAAREVLGLRFDGSDAALHLLRMKRNVVTFPYDGNQPRNDVIQPLKVELQKFLKLRENDSFSKSVQNMNKILQQFAKNRQSVETNA